jgi:hypothetical protein
MSTLPARSLIVTALGVLPVLAGVVYAVGFDQGALAAPLTDAMASSGGVLHELFHDARHLLGVPCH